MSNIEFLREREKSCREYAAGINPCADAGDKIKSAVLERADQFKACADALEAKAADDWVPLAKALFQIEHDPSITDQAWFDFQNKAQRILAIINSSSGKSDASR